MFKPQKINLQDKGLGKVLGSLERRILEYLWKEKQGTAREICEALCKKARISFNAVSTVLNRLVEKGVLTRKKTESYFVYAPAMKREIFTEQVSRNLLTSLLRDKELFSAHALFVALEDLTPSERKRVRELIKEVKI